MKTIKISNQTHAKLTKIVGQLTAETGKIATYEEAISALLKEVERKESINLRDTRQ
jgi:hypothetical protein